MVVRIALRASVVRVLSPRAGWVVDVGRANLGHREPGGARSVPPSTTERTPDPKWRPF